MKYRGMGNFDYYVYKYKPSGSLISSVKIPVSVYEITSFGNRLFGAYSNAVYELDVDTGSVKNHFYLPWETYTRGLTNDGKDLWALYGSSGEEIYKISTTGSVIYSIPALNEDVYGLGYYNSFLWYFDDSSKNIIQAKESNGDIVNEYRYMPGMRRMAYDGQCIWFGSDDKITRINHKTSKVLAEWSAPEDHELRAVTVVFK
jgi:outer membrane protein assembly factor BamB